MNKLGAVKTPLFLIMMFDELAFHAKRNQFCKKQQNISQIKVHVLAYPKENYSQYIELSNPILDVSMVEFENSLPQDGVVTLLLE